MDMRTLGKSEVRVSEIGIGCWPIGGPDWNLNREMGWGGIDDKKSMAGLHRAFDLGANFFDTADVYGHGHSERLIGTFLKEVGRDKVVVATKVGYFHGCAPHAYHPLHLRHQLEMSLSNLGTDYIDIYSFHNLYFGEHNEYLVDAIDAMHRFKEEGKIRVIGQRGPHRYAAHRAEKVGDQDDKYEHFLKVAAVVDPDIIQVRYNLISSTLDAKETDVFAWAEQHNVGVVINKPLGQGLLLDKYDPDNPPKFDLGDHRRRKKWFRSEGLYLLRKRLTRIEEHFGNTLSDMLRVALQYCLARSEKACVIVGFKTPEQVEMNVAVAGQYLSSNDVQYIREVMVGVSEEIGEFFVSEDEND